MKQTEIVRHLGTHVLDDSPRCRFDLHAEQIARSVRQYTVTHNERAYGILTRYGIDDYRLQLTDTPDVIVVPKATRIHLAEKCPDRFMFHAKRGALRFIADVYHLWEEPTTPAGRALASRKD